MTVADRFLAWPIVINYIGDTIISMAQVRNVRNDELRADDILAVQLNFEGGRSLLLKGAGDGESLIAETNQWQDLLEGKQAREVQDYVEQFGHWALIEISQEIPYSALIEKVIQTVYPITATNDALSGVQFVIDGKYLNIIVVWDECWVLWGRHHESFDAMQVKVDYEIDWSQGDRPK